MKVCKVTPVFKLPLPGQRRRCNLLSGGFFKSSIRRFNLSINCFQQRHENLRSVEKQKTKFEFESGEHERQMVPHQKSTYIDFVPQECTWKLE
jgi:hypothetical protein